MRVAITGISGRFGALLTRRLHRQHTVVGIDRRPFPSAPADVELHRIDIRRKRCEEVFRKGAFDAVVHLNVMHDPRASSADHHTFNIQGTTRVMQYCQVNSGRQFRRFEPAFGSHSPVDQHATIDGAYLKMPGFFSCVFTDHLIIGFSVATAHAKRIAGLRHGEDSDWAVEYLS